MNEAIATAILSSGMLLAVPILWAALGEAVTEQAGVINVGIEAVMLVGAFAAGIGVRWTEDLTLSLLLAIVAGMLAGLLLSLLYVRRGTDQIVTGILLSTLALGLTTVLDDRYLKGISTAAGVFSSLAIPGLSEVPVIGPAFFDQNALVYAAVLVAPVIFYVLRGTWFGLYVRAVGERPSAGELAGLDVELLRTAALVLGSALVAIGGATIVLTQSGDFTVGITGGQGFIALAVVILARWNPLLIIGGAALFGISTAFQFQAQALGWTDTVPEEFWSILPYVVTIGAVLVGRSARYPASVGIPYRRPGLSGRS